MKKLLVYALAIFSTCAVEALPLGNPTQASYLTNGIIFNDGFNQNPSFINWLTSVIGVDGGFYGDYVFNRKMKVDRPSHPNLQKVELITNAGYLVINAFNFIEAFGTFGASKIFFETPISALNLSGSNNAIFKIRSTQAFSWSAGLRGTAFEFHGFRIGGELQYFYTRPKLHTYQIEGGSTPYFDNADFPMKYQERQIGLGLSYQAMVDAFGTSFVPYVGVKWARAFLDMNEVSPPLSGVRLFDFKNQRYFGYAVGMSFIGASRFEATAEIRFVDEYALHVNALVRF